MDSGIQGRNRDSSFLTQNNPSTPKEVEIDQKSQRIKNNKKEKEKKKRQMKSNSKRNQTERSKRKKEWLQEGELRNKKSGRRAQERYLARAT
uniref:Uncharacterized protein n=1 Tax=Nymphaea colorata TaxID=210225 RepID=A0A5K0V264_9MAGN